ncbi:MAG: hypothetical protein JWR30_3434 [Conexibacter sp.]|nr:hypothetical protein [Conexibacter sp.]MCZ4493721.1 hypothetical protein [Conexibacter sp.]MDX6715902.1 hypothetical protein [Baekduia sp.]
MRAGRPRGIGSRPQHGCGFSRTSPWGTADGRASPRAYARAVDHRRQPAGAVTRVVIAHATVAGRLALRMLMENEPELELVAAAATAADAGRVARERHADFLVLYEGLLATGRTGVLPAACTVVLLGMEGRPAAGTAALIPGARRYVLWDRAAEDLPPVLRGRATPTVSPA